MDCFSFNVSSLKVTCFKNEHAEGPLVYAHLSKQEAESLLLKVDIPFSLVAIEGNAWEKDFSPFHHSKVFHGGTDFSGGASAYLKTLIHVILPQAETYLGIPSSRALIGYSLAGLLAFYSLYETPLFSYIGCVSGSLWFPNMKELINEKAPLSLPKKVYFSLGEKESQTKNVYLSKANECMEFAYKKMILLGVPSVYMINKGGHFEDPLGRMASCLKYLLA